jgi:hypothetical protein
MGQSSSTKSSLKKPKLKKKSSCNQLMKGEESKLSQLFGSKQASNPEDDAITMSIDQGSML